MTSREAPEFPDEQLTWFNVPKSTGLRLRDLRGKLVILDFWTSCCINCIHALSTLELVENTFGDQVVVIGVHSPKFISERNERSVGAAVRRYGIRHPVVHDPDFSIWRAYSIHAWPTLVIISPDGRVIARLPGEPDAQQLLELISQSLQYWNRLGKSEPRTLAFAPLPEQSGRFRFPGKLRPIPTEVKNWALADSGHNQIVILDNSGTEVARYGQGERGFLDGAASRALFDSPQGLSATENEIFVADTGNHAIRRIDYGSGEVTTLAGTRERGAVLGSPATALSTALASPWDVVDVGNLLIFANAGTHQLGVVDLSSGLVRRLAGTGHEAIDDGPADRATLAQPSGLALSPDRCDLYLVDSETSAVRRLKLGDHPYVSTLVGRGLFDFGHTNGTLADASFQHPLGIAWLDGSLIVADTYNSAIRTIDLSKGSVRDFDDSDFLCTDPLCQPLAEPSGVVADGLDRLLVVDTNNHRIIEYSLPIKQYRTWAA